MTALPKPRAVLYDWDNTLVDTWDTIAEAVNHTLVRFGHRPWDPEESRARIQKSMRDSFPTLFGDRWTEARDVFYAWIEAHHLERLKPLAGAEALLKAFAEHGVYQAVVSNKTGRFLRAEAEALEWTGYFGALVGSGDAERDKPHPYAVELALTSSGIAPGPDVWYVGDADIDVECAEASGLTAIRIGVANGEDQPRLTPNAHFSTCQALSGLVDIGLATISVADEAEPVWTSP
jgi:phosphoglycolate phosphatase